MAFQCLKKCLILTRINFRSILPWNENTGCFGKGIHGWSNGRRRGDKNMRFMKRKENTRRRTKTVSRKRGSPRTNKNADYVTCILINDEKVHFSFCHVMLVIEHITKFDKSPKLSVDVVNTFTDAPTIPLQPLIQTLDLFTHSFYFRKNRYPSCTNLHMSLHRSFFC